MSAVNQAAAPLPAAAGSEPERLQYLTFMLGGGVFAVGILRIKEIIEYGELTVVPRMPEFIRGVINLRGAVVPVVDLAVRFGGEATAVTRRTCVVIIEVDDEGDSSQQVIGVMVDAVNEVIEIPADQVEPAPTFGASIRADFIQGMGKVDGRFIIVLDVTRVLSLDEMASLVNLAAPEAAMAAA
ncbi:MAG TPA: chemotaxis protein CheW [Rhodocyclaceae bacterium]|nr:chemotaxis protein CheW [Rhodocyclaceae bacterium]